MPSPKELVRQQRRAKQVRRQRFLRARNVDDSNRRVILKYRLKLGQHADGRRGDDRHRIASQARRLSPVSVGTASDDGAGLPPSTS